MKSNLRQVLANVGATQESGVGTVPGKRGVTLDTFFNGALIFFAVAFFTAAAAQGLA